MLINFVDAKCVQAMSKSAYCHGFHDTHAATDSGIRLLSIESDQLRNKHNAL